MKPALLVVDVQKAFFERDPVTSRSLEDAVEYINAAIALFRNRVCRSSASSKWRRRTASSRVETGFEVPDHVDVLASDVHIHKTYGNAFNKNAAARRVAAARAWTP